MELKTHPTPEVTEELVDAIRLFPLGREVEHCGQRFVVNPFAFYASCPLCATRMKLRSFSAGVEIEDVFDAVFEWMARPGAEEYATNRRRQLAEEE